MKKILKKFSKKDHAEEEVDSSIDLRGQEFEDEENEELDYYDDELADEYEDEEEDEYSDEEEEIAEEEEKEAKVEQAKEEKTWLEDSFEEGQLSIDVYQTDDSLIVKSTIAGVKPEDIDISINNDMLTIRGKREMTEEIRDDNYLYRECYWGSFSRSIILPVEVEADKIEATLENGVLSVTLPKAQSAKQISIKVRSK